MSNHASIPCLGGYDSIAAQIVTIGPDVAEQWLGRNTRNRNVSEASVRQYVSDMEADRWHFTTQSIAFDETGRLIDGQHRLTAQVRSNTTRTWLVVTGVPADVQNFIDIGRVRTVGNQLQIAGYDNPRRMGSVGSMALAYEGPTMYPSKPAAREYAEAHADEIQTALSQTGGLVKQFKGSQAVYAYVAMILNRIDRDASGEFFDLATNGVSLPEGSPILAFRAALLKRLQNTSAGSAGMGTPQRVAFVNYMFRVWNYWRAGKTVKTVRIPEGTVTPR